MTRMIVAVACFCLMPLPSVACSEEKSGHEEYVTITAGGTADKPLVKFSSGHLVVTSSELKLTNGKKSVMVIRAVGNQVWMTSTDSAGENERRLSCTEIKLLCTCPLPIGKRQD